MAAYSVAMVVAVYLGLLTSISPCPLATNIVAISYVARKVGNPRAVLYAGLLYTLGRSLVYLVLAIVLSNMALSATGVSVFLQKSIHLVLGPIFLVLGMLLLGLITSTGSPSRITEGIQKRLDRMGLWGAFGMGILFALSFCPTSAVWFFGLLAFIVGSVSGAVSTTLAKIGLSVHQSTLPGGTVVLPILYGMATAAPVMLMAGLLAYGAHWVGKAYNMFSEVERIARLATGWLFILVGMYFTLLYVFEVGT